MFLQTVESSFDHTVEFFWQNPNKFCSMSKNDLQNIFILRKKPIFSQNVPLDTEKFFWQNRKVSRSMSENMSKTFFFQKKTFFGEKLPLDMYNAVLTTPSKNFDKGSKNLRSMSENDQKQYKNFYFRKGLRLNCSYGHVKICLDKPAEIFFDRTRIFFGPCRKC